MSGLHFYSSLGIGSYRVELDGQQIGYVRKHEIRYNLRRLAVDRFWQATEADSEVDGRRIPGDVVGRRPTRQAAAELLVARWREATCAD